MIKYDYERVCGCFIASVFLEGELHTGLVYIIDNNRFHNPYSSDIMLHHLGGFYDENGVHHRTIEEQHLQRVDFPSGEPAIHYPFKDENGDIWFIHYHMDFTCVRKYFKDLGMREPHYVYHYNETRIKKDSKLIVE